MPHNEEGLGEEGLGEEGLGEEGLGEEGLGEEGLGEEGLGEEGGFLIRVMECQIYRDLAKNVLYDLNFEMIQ